MFGSCSTQNPNCFSLMGRGLAWTATTEARLKADLAAGLGTAAIAKKHCWNVVSVRRAIRKVRSGASLLTKGRRSKITETASDYIKEMSEKDKSLAQIRRGTTTDFGVTLSRSAISRHLRTKLKKKSVKKVRTFRLRDVNQKKRKAFCEQLLPRLKNLGRLGCCRNVGQVLTCEASCSLMKSSSVSSRMTGSNGCGWTVGRRRRSHYSESRVSFGCVHTDFLFIRCTSGGQCL